MTRPAWPAAAPFPAHAGMNREARVLMRCITGRCDKGQEFPPGPWSRERPFWSGLKCQILADILDQFRPLRDQAEKDAGSSGGAAAALLPFLVGARRDIDQAGKF